jgi:holo-[acyl-carrier protein] synthase
MFSVKTGDTPNGGRVIGVGTDIIEVERIEAMLQRHEESFLQRVFTQEETRYCSQHKAAAQHFAGRWAAKEAVLKALGTGWAKGIHWTDIEVINEAGGAPRIDLHGAAAQYATQLAIREIKISISHCKAFAVACAIAVG